MSKALGLIEFNSIARGIESADIMLKTAQVQMVQARPVCPGKYIAIIAGDMGAVEASMQEGIKDGDALIVDTLLIPNLRSDVIEAILAAGPVRRQNAVGIMEYFSIASAVVGADEAAKTSDITLIEVRLGIGIGGKSFVSLTGDVGAVKEAVRAGCREAEKNGMLITSTVIPSLSREMWEFIL